MPTDEYIERIFHADRMLALILRAEFFRQGITFLTPPEFSQQLGHMWHEKGYVIPPHVHNKVMRSVELTQEVLFIRAGKVRLDLYTQEREYLFSRELAQGDFVLLAHGGHGLTMLEDAEIVEVKQGPYAGDNDKTRFDKVDESCIVLS